MRLNLIVPDIRVIWNKIAYKAALNELRGRKYDLVVTSGPPHSTHLVGLELKKRFSVKWITDFRDPWTTIYYLQDVNQNRFLSAINKKLEKSVVEKSDLNIIVSQSIADNLPAGIKKVLTNGFDPEDFYNLETIPSSFFRAKYVGKLTEGQDTENPLKWLHELSKERKMGNIEFSFVGTLIASRNYDKKYPLIHMRQIGYVTHHRAISEMYNADLLLLFINNCPDNKGILTTKLFEYIGSKTFILGIGPVDSEAARILKDYKAGVMVDYNDKDGFCRIVSENYEKWGKRISTKNNTDITPLSSPEQTNKLIELIDLD